MTDAVLDELRYTMAHMDEIIYRLSCKPSFLDLDFLKECAQECASGTPFPDAWKISLKHSRCQFLREDLQILYALGETLGNSDLSGQTLALAHCKNMLSTRLEDARFQKNSKSKLYRTLGVLSGAAVVIFFL